MEGDQIIVVVVFLLVFLAILTEVLDKTIIVLLAAVGLVISGMLSFDQAIRAVDFDTICLLLGMMLLVDSIKAVHLFDWLTVKLGVFSGGNPFRIFVLLGSATAFCSAFLDNVTTVLVLAPLVISLTRGIGLAPEIFLVSTIFLSNIGGTATLIGDPPNILIGSQVEELTFGSFIQYLTVPVLISAIGAMWYLSATNREVVQTRSKNFSWLFMSSLMLEDLKRKDEQLFIPRPVFVKSLSILALVLAGFFTHTLTHLEPAVIALAGAILMLLAFRKQTDVHHLLAKLEWSTLIFFAGLFVVVGALEHAGVLSLVSAWLVSLTTDMWILLMLVLWISALLSAVVDNIPFVAVMIPVLKDLTQSGPFQGHPKAHLLWWALSLGACFGGNGTVIGASANVVTLGIARSEGIPISFRRFLRYSIPVTLISIVVSTVYLTILYYW